MRAVTRKSLLILLAGILVLVLLAAGCSSAETTTTPVNTTPGAQKTVVPAPATTTAPTIIPLDTSPPSYTPLTADVSTPASVTVTPAEDTNSIKTQHTFIAVVKEAGGTPSIGAEVQWILNRFPDAVGDIVDVSNQTKVDNLFAISKTDTNGEARMTITATRAGDTDVTVFVPGITDTAKHKVFAVKHWVDMTVEWPANAVNKIGTEHTLPVKIVKVSDGSPVTGINVAWTITDDTPDLRFKGLAPAVNTATATTGADGIATVTVQQSIAAAGENVIRIDVYTAGGILLMSQDVSKKWLSPSLNILKEGPAIVKEGDSIQYTITVRNDGDDTAAAVQVVDTIPAAFTYVSSTPAGVVSGTSVTWSVGAIAPNASTTIVANFTAKTGGYWTNTVKATSYEGITAQASAAIQITPKATSVSVTKTGSTAVYLNKNGQFTIAVTNTGEKDLTNVKVVDTLPAGFTYVSSTPAATAVGQTVTWTIASLATGASQSMTIICKAVTAGAFTNSVTVTSNEGATDTATSAGAITAETGITVQLTDTIDPVAVGSQTTYQVTITNQGDAAVHNLKIVFQLPTQVSFVLATGATGYSLDGQAVTFQDIATLAAGDSVVMSVTVKANSAGDVVCTVTRSYAEFSTPTTLQEGTTIYAP